MPQRYVDVSVGDLVVLDSQMFRDRYVVAVIKKVTPETVVTHVWKDSEDRFLTKGVRRSRRSVEGLIPIKGKQTPEQTAAAVHLTLEEARRAMELARNAAETRYRGVVLGLVARNTGGPDDRS